MTQARRDEIAWVALRLCLACLLAAHGWARLLDGGVQGFGGWLGSQGLPGGVVIAGVITAVEVLGTPLLAAGRFVVPLCVYYAAVLLMGIIMVHGPEGWFVVGAGRNGAEYSVLLIVGLLSVALHSNGR